jgi:non-specific serine/threonine protein kinase
VGVVEGAAPGGPAAAVGARDESPPESTALSPTELRARRRRLGLTQAALGAALGVAGNTVARWERGALRIGAPELVRLALERLALERLARPAPTESPTRSPTPAHNLPASPTRLIGRERELAAVRAHVRRPGTRLVTLTGAPGIGKTRLALAVAAGLLRDFPDGVWLAPLEGVPDPDLVLPAVAQAVGVRNAGAPPAEALRAALGGGRTLLVLDNCEQVLAAGPQLSALLAACPRTALLATSRAALRLSGEHVFDVPPLALPPRDGSADPAAVVERVASYAAVRLFVARARAAAHAFALTPANAAAVAELCRRLDGLPLAIELAAAWAPALPPPALLERFGGRLRLLAGGARDLPARQRTLRAAIAWSHDLLSADERRLFRRLAVFAGGFTFEAAAAVGDADGTPPVDVAEGVASLVGQSLVCPAEQPAGPAAATAGSRFRLLETIREDALARLEASGEAAAVRARHAAHYLALAERAAPALVGPAAPGWLARLEAEHDNLRAALGWATDHDPAAGLRLGAALWRFWAQRGHVPEGRAWLARLLALPDAPAGGATPAAPAGAAPRARAAALCAAGALADEQDDHPAARAAYAAGLARWEALADPGGIAAAHQGLGDVCRHTGARAAARRHYERALATWRARGERAAAAQTLFGLGVLAGGEPDGGAVRRARLEESLALWRAVGDRSGAAWSLHLLGVDAEEQGDDAAAGAFFAEGLRLREAAGDRLGAAYSLARLAALASRRNEHAAAGALAARGLGIARRSTDRWLLANLLTNAAAARRGRGREDEALRLLGAAARLFEAVDHPRSAQRVRERAGARAAAGAGRAAWAAGQALPLEDAIALAVATDPPGGGRRERPGARAARAGGAPEGLTRREWEVAQLVAEGLSNPQIAARLAVSGRTVDTHVARVLGKLGLARRTQLVAWIVERRGAAPAPA